MNNETYNFVQSENVNNSKGERAYTTEMRELLARMLCYGLRAEERLTTKVVKDYGLDTGFIHGIIWEVANRWHVNTAFLDCMTRSDLAVQVEEIDDQLVTRLDDKYIPCTPIKQPTSIASNWPRYGPISQFIRLHNQHSIFATPVRECIFGAIGKACTFCTYDMSKPRPLPPAVFVEMLRRVIDETGPDVELALGAATPSLTDHGVEYFSMIIEQVWHEFHIPASVEMVPPKNLNDLDRLIDAGIKSLVMSIEVWDDNIREDVCPGKSVIEKADYIAAWTKGLAALGRGQVSSVLLVGLEPENSTKAGIDYMIGLGVIPTLIPFRPYDAAKLRGHQLTDHHQYLRCSSHCSNQLAAAGLSPLQQFGCTKCGACSLEIYLEQEKVASSDTPPSRTHEAKPLSVMSRLNPDSMLENLHPNK